MLLLLLLLLLLHHSNHHAKKLYELFKLILFTIMNFCYPSCFTFFSPHLFRLMFSITIICVPFFFSLFHSVLLWKVLFKFFVFFIHFFVVVCFALVKWSFLFSIQRTHTHTHSHTRWKEKKKKCKQKNYLYIFLSNNVALKHSPSKRKSLSKAAQRSTENESENHRKYFEWKPHK